MLFFSDPLFKKVRISSPFFNEKVISDLLVLTFSVLIPK